MTVSLITFLRVIPTMTFLKNRHVDTTLVADLSGKVVRFYVILISSYSSLPPPLPPPPRPLLYCDHLRRAYLQNVQWELADVSPSIHSSISPFLQGATWCTLLWRCAESNCFNSNALEIGHVCFVRISCTSIPTKTVSKLSAKSLGRNSLVAGRVGACSRMVVTPSSPHARDSSCRPWKTPLWELLCATATPFC